jgi:hypothetical protein
VANQEPDQAQDQLHVPILDIRVSWIQGSRFRVANQGPDQAQDQLHVPILDISVSWI